MVNYRINRIFATMELRQLKYFLKVAETLNFSMATKELFITQFLSPPFLAFRLVAMLQQFEYLLFRI